MCILLLAVKRGAEDKNMRLITYVSYSQYCQTVQKYYPKNLLIYIEHKSLAIYMRRFFGQYFFTVRQYNLDVVLSDSTI